MSPFADPMPPLCHNLSMSVMSQLQISSRDGHRCVWGCGCLVVRLSGDREIRPGPLPGAMCGSRQPARRHLMSTHREVTRFTILEHTREPRLFSFGQVDSGLDVASSETVVVPSPMMRHQDWSPLDLGSKGGTSEIFVGCSAHRFPL